MKLRRQARRLGHQPSAQVSEQEVADPQGARVDAERDRQGGDDAAGGRRRARGAGHARRRGAGRPALRAQPLPGLRGRPRPPARGPVREGPVPSGPARDRGNPNGGIEQRRRLADPRCRETGSRALRRPRVPTGSRDPRRDAPGDDGLSPSWWTSTAGSPACSRSTTS